VETSVETTVGTVETRRLDIRLFGPLRVFRDGAEVELPQSRKARALLAYLVLVRAPVSRSRLCDLLWDGPNDPRGELRWCLSKLRGVLDDGPLSRIESRDDAVAIRLDGCHVDAIELDAAATQGIDRIDGEKLRTLAALISGELLDGLDLDRSPHFSAWLSAQRRRFQAVQVAVLEQLVSRQTQAGEEQMGWLQRWLELAPFDLRAHRALLGGLRADGRLDAASEHLAVATRLFQSEEMDPSPLRDLWEDVRAMPAAQRLATVTPVVDDASGAPPRDERLAHKRASLAVMPFQDLDAGATGSRGLADGLTHDIITRLARLRDFFVIARGSVYALAERGIGPEDAGRRLDVDYVASGTVRRIGERVSVSVELVEVATARIVWSDAFEPRQGDVFSVLHDIGNSIVVAIAAGIETSERNRAILKSPNSLNAWEAYHRGLWHMYRFTREENDKARHFFALATDLDPTFARAHAGMSFTHWQSAFQHWGDRDHESGLAYEAAGRSVLLDDHSPAAHWAMGRALWLRGSNDESLGELGRAVDLSPNFALGHYALSFVHSQSGDPLAAIGAADQSRSLSPFDPLLFGMLGTRAMAHVRLGQFEEAVEWALKAAARPNAHILIKAMAANCLGLTNRIEEGRAMAVRVRQSQPNFSVDDFLTSFQMDADGNRLFRQGARLIGLD